MLRLFCFPNQPWHIYLRPQKSDAFILLLGFTILYLALSSEKFFQLFLKKTFTKRPPYSQLVKGTVQQRKNHSLPVEDCCDTPYIPQWKLEMIATYIFQHYISDSDRVLHLANELLEKHFKDETERDDHSELIVSKEKEITAYAETKAESRLINAYIENSPLKFKRLVQPA